MSSPELTQPNVPASAAESRDTKATEYPKVAYVMSRFPHLPETFILREMNELEKRGWPIALYPLILQNQTIIHEDARNWLSRAKKVGFLSVSGLLANLQMLFRKPLTLARVYARSIWENSSSFKFLIRTLVLLPKSVEMAQRMQREGVVHVHAHYATHPALVAWVIHQLTGISYSITAHAHDIYVQQEMLCTKLKDAAFIAAISEFNRGFMTRHCGEGIREKIHIVHCGIIPANYPEVEHRDESAEFHLLCTGSLQLYKGQKHLVEACRLLRERGVPVRCSIIGGGEELDDLQARIKEAELEGVVTLLGPQPQEEVARLLPQADCYVQPSIITPEGKMEGIPVSLMEALACRLPVVATDISGISELVRPGETGYLVPEADPVALADAIENAYRHPEQAAELGRAGRELVLKEFELTHNVRLLEELLIKQNRSHG